MDSVYGLVHITMNRIYLPLTAYIYSIRRTAMRSYLSTLTASGCTLHFEQHVRPSATIDLGRVSKSISNSCARTQENLSSRYGPVALNFAPSFYRARRRTDEGTTLDADSSATQSRWSARQSHRGKIITIGHSASAPLPPFGPSVARVFRARVTRAAPLQLVFAVRRSCTKSWLSLLHLAHFAIIFS